LAATLLNLRALPCQAGLLGTILHDIDQSKHLLSVAALTNNIAPNGNSSFDVTDV